MATRPQTRNLNGPIASSPTLGPLDMIMLSDGERR